MKNLKVRNYEGFEVKVKCSPDESLGFFGSFIQVVVKKPVLNIDDIKKIMASIYCLGCESEDIKIQSERKLYITYLKDCYNKPSTLILSLEGSPPKAQAVIPDILERINTLNSLKDIERVYTISHFSVIAKGKIGIVIPDPKITRLKLDLKGLSKRKDCILDL